MSETYEVTLARERDGVTAAEFERNGFHVRYSLTTEWDANGWPLASRPGDIVPSGTRIPPGAEIYIQRIPEEQSD